jgi:hypothetical protein
VRSVAVRRGAVAPATKAAGTVRYHHRASATETTASRCLARSCARWERGSVSLLQLHRTTTTRGETPFNVDRRAQLGPSPAATASPSTTTSRIVAPHAGGITDHIRLRVRMAGHDLIKSLHGRGTVRDLRVNGSLDVSRNRYADGAPVHRHGVSTA